MATLGMSKETRVLHTRATLGTMQTVWVKVLVQPDLALFIIADIENWKIHVRSISP